MDLGFDLTFGLIADIVTILGIGFAIGVWWGRRQSRMDYGPFLTDYRTQKKQMWKKILKKL